MGSDDGRERCPPVTYARSRRPHDEETVPDSEDSTSRAEPRPPKDRDDDSPKQPINGDSDESEPPRPRRAIYRSVKRSLSPPSLSYTTVASTEEVIPDSEENGRDVGSSGDEDCRKNSASNSPRTTSSGLSDWKQQLRDIDAEYDMDDCSSGPHDIASNSIKETSSVDPFGSPLTTHASSQLASHRSRPDELPSSPPLNASSSTNTTPQFVFGTPQAPSPTPPTSDGKPSPIPKTKTKGKAKGKTRGPSEVQEASLDDQLVPSPKGVSQTRRKEKQKKSKALSRKEQLEARCETARMRSDMRVSISTEATRDLPIDALFNRFIGRKPEARPLLPHSSTSEIEAWSSSSPAVSTPDHGSHQDGNAEPSHQQSISSRRSASPFHSNGLLAPASKYKSVSFADTDDPFLVTAPKETDADADAGSSSSSDVEMPGIGAILAEKQAREDQRSRQEQLQRLKLAALEKQKKTADAVAADDSEDSDDGLDVVPDTMHSVAREEAAARASAGRTRPSAGRNTQLRFARVAPSPQRPTLPTQSPEKRMASAARSRFLASSARDNGAAGTADGRGKRGGGMTKTELDKMMLRNAEAQSEGRRREKEEEWVRRGGRVTGVMEDVGSEKLQALVEKVKERGGGANTQDSGDDDDDSDGDYVPIERGSMSPQPAEAQEEGHDNEKTVADKEMADEDECRVTGVHTMEAAADTDSEMESSAPDDVHLRRPRGARPRRAVIGSDDEATESGAENAVEEDVHPPPLSLPDLPSPAFSSPLPSRHPGPDHGDEKENDPYVSGNDTDKENRFVMCRAPSGSAPVQGARVLFDDLLGAPAGTGASVQPLPLLCEDDPFVFTPSPAKAREDALRRLSSPTPMRVFGASGKRGLSQMFEEEENGAPAPQSGNDVATGGNVDPGLVAPALGGLSQAFEQTQDTLGSVTGAGGFAALRRGGDAEFSLTLDAQAVALQPALEVDDHLRAQAAAIFEKEQEYVIQAAQPAASRPRRELYITENGFLTQTRPEGSSSPLVYRPSPSQRPYEALLRTQSGSVLGTGTAASSPFPGRQPLSTLAETSPMSSVGREPLRRLRRAQTSPEAPVATSEKRYAYPRGQSLSPSPSPSPAKAKSGAATPVMMMQGRTAFSEIMMGAKLALHRDNEKVKAKKRSEFVEDQAVESDEDDMLGFGGVRKKNGDDEDEEDDERDAEVIKDLVDDAQMDESALAKSKVLEKHLEQQNEDDERLEKEVNDVVAGKRRTRRRRGGAGGLLGSDASDDESSDDEEARALRRRLAKKRRIEGDTLDALARDPATAPFHATYQMGLLDDVDDFAHLDRDDGEDGGAQENQERGAREEAEGDGEDERRRGRDADEDVEMAAPDDADKEISAATLRKKLQDIARGKQEYHAHDPEDVSWVDQDPDGADDVATTRVRMASSAPSKAPPPAQLIPADADMDVLSLRRIHADEQNDAAYAQRMKRWAKDEGASNLHNNRRAGTGTAAGAGAAVTGHRPRGTATRQAVPKRTAGAAAAPGSVRRTASALSAVANRSARFGA